MKKGFTLIELLVVVSIIGVLAIIIVSSLNTAQNKSRDIVAYKKAQELQKAIETYAIFEGSYPTSGDENNSGYGPYSVASSCDNFTDTTHGRNWEDFVTAMGDYLPEYWSTIEEFPYCYFYTTFPPPGACNPPPNAEYAIVTRLYDSGISNYEHQYLDTEGRTVVCLYSL